MQKEIGVDQQVGAISKVVSPTADAQSFKRRRYMYGTVTQIELNNFLEGNSIDDEEKKRDIKVKWLQAAEAFQALVKDEAGLPDTISIKTLDPKVNSILGKIQVEAAFQKAFSNYPLSFAEVEIDKIVASQRSVDLDYVERVKEIFNATDKNLLNFCLRPAQDDTRVSVGRTAANAFTFASENPGLRFLGVFDTLYVPETMDKFHPGGQPVHTVTLLIGYGIATINVYQVGKRLILNNGFHRLYALRSLGVTHAPVVIQHVTHPELELGPNITELPRDYLVSTARPGLMKDFFNDNLNCEVRQRNILKSLEVAWADTPRIIPR